MYIAGLDLPGSATIEITYQEARIARKVAVIITRLAGTPGLPARRVDLERVLLASPGPASGFRLLRPEDDTSVYYLGEHDVKVLRSYVSLLGRIAEANRDI